ncbi:MAG: hypothetical protein Q8P44_04255 [Dehalococcoidia bacterium]|nr:hypothetical protein [Dehalococcoidia bacterium]
MFFHYSIASLKLSKKDLWFSRHHRSVTGGVILLKHVIFDEPGINPLLPAQEAAKIYRHVK